MTEELRCYTFTLYQLSSIQQGIQAGHAAVELGMKAHTRLIRNLNGDHWAAYHEWATHHKTMVLLNGGDLNELCELRNFLGSENNKFPWAPFYESADSLGGLLTSIAVILPARIFELASNMRRAPEAYTGQLLATCSFWEVGMIERLNAAGLAR